MDTNTLEKLSFEEGYDRLERVIQQLESGELSLEQAVALYEEGVQLARYCGHKLDDAELRVTQLLTSADTETNADDTLF